VKFTPTAIPGVMLAEAEPVADNRGYFARSFCQREFEAAGLAPVIAQANISFNHRAGTLRGLHFHVGAPEEHKLIRVTRGALYDVAVDLRPQSPSFKRWVGVELSAENGKALYLPQGIAHGFITLSDDTEALYFMSSAYDAAGQRGLAFDDPEIAVAWPRPVAVISERDQGLPKLSGLDPAELAQLGQGG